jgi:hypothetical protein
MTQWYEELFRDYAGKENLIIDFIIMDACASLKPGCKQGAFSRNDKLTTDDFEMLVIAEK